MLHTIKETITMRRTAPMKSNTVSSRGHLFLKFTLEEDVGRRAAVLGGIVIVDIAGNEDYLTSDRQAETRWINTQNSTPTNVCVWCGDGWCREARRVS